MIDMKVKKSGFLTLCLVGLAAVILAGSLVACTSRADKEIEQEKVTVEFNIEPAGAGIVAGAGSYAKGEEVTLIAADADGYFFSRWSIDWEEVSAERAYRFIVDQDTVITAEFVVDPAHPLIVKAKEALAKESWREAGDYLEEAREKRQAVRNPMLQNIIELTGVFDIIGALQNEYVVTAERVLSDLEELKKIAPPAPVNAILEQEALLLFEWFLKLQEWRKEISLLHWNNYYDELIHEEAIELIYEASLEYLEWPVTLCMLSEWSAGDTFYFIGIYGPYSPGGYGVFDSDFYMSWSEGNIRLVDAEAGEDTVTITLETKKPLLDTRTMEDLEPGKYQIIYDIHKKDNSTFRVGNYKVKDQQTGEIIFEASISHDIF